MSANSDKVEFLIKKALGIVSTHMDVPWYKETKKKHKTTIDSEDIKIERVPTIPIWKESSLTHAELANLKFDSNHFSDTDIPFSSIHMLESDTYKTNGSRLPGVYYDTSNTVALVVRLKLDRFVGDANMDASAIVYTKYKTDSSNDSLLDNAYQFNYNTQINVGSPTIPVFKPYNYILEYSPDSDSSNFQQVTNDIGNWSFDNNSGIITFEADPSSEINLSSGNLYLTFVKYIGVCGFENLLYYKDKKIGIGTKEPNAELDISGSVNITGSLEVGKDLYIADDVLYVDSSNKKVGINTITPLTELDVSGDATIRNLDISGGVGHGPGFCPIGTIIMWPGHDKPSYDKYGDWLLCDGSVDISKSKYPELTTILGANGEYINIPDFRNKYIKGANLNDSAMNFGGTGNTSNISLSSDNMPDHTHDITHKHTLSGTHSHECTNNHNHSLNANQHTHAINNTHSHGVQIDNHTHVLIDHIHNVSFTSHSHNTQHQHNQSSIDHAHDYQSIGSVTFNRTEAGSDENSNLLQYNSEVNSSTDTYNSITASLTANMQQTQVNDSGQSSLGISTLNVNGSNSNCNTNNQRINATYNNTNGLDTGNKQDETVTLGKAIGLQTGNEGLGITLGNFNLVHPMDNVVHDTFTFSASMKCIEILYYIRAS